MNDEWLIAMIKFRLLNDAQRSNYLKMLCDLYPDDWTMDDMDLLICSGLFRLTLGANTLNIVLEVNDGYWLVNNK